MIIDIDPSPKEEYCACWGGKFFKTVEEMFEYQKNWPKMPADLEYYRKFLEDRFKEAEINVKGNPHFTNRDLFWLLRMNTEWV